MTTKRELTDRWSTRGGGAELAEEVIARLLANRSLDGLGLDHHDGLVDLRGLPAPIPRRLQRFEAAGWFVEQLGDTVKFNGATLSGLDLSAAQLQSFRFRHSSIVGCRFDSASCRDWRLWDTEVTDCSFARSDLRGGAVGTWHDGHRNVWRRISFAGADFRVGVSWSALYEDCDFSAARLDKVKFEQCTFVRCGFSGVLRGVVFDGREIHDRPAPPPMMDVDFAEARFDQVEFMGVTLGHVTIPHDPDVRLIANFRCVVERALALLDGEDSMPARMLRAEFQNRLRMMRTANEDNIINYRDYASSGGDELATFATEVYGRAEAACTDH